MLPLRVKQLRQRAGGHTRALLAGQVHHDAPAVHHDGAAADAQRILSVRDLVVRFSLRGQTLTAIRGASLDLYKGESLAIVGESGSGKTTIGRTIMRIQPLSTGEILFKGQRISGRIPHALDHEITRQIQMIFQDPMASLNERAKVEYIVAEGLYAMHKHVSREYVSEAVSRTLSAVGLLPEFASRFPHEFSGGQRQRIGIARALIMEPEFIIADEPISALDVSIRAQVLNLLSKLQRERALTYLFISHDLSVMRFICDRIAVVHLGQIVELADTDTLYRHPLHPYTRALLSAIPQPNSHVEHKKKLLVYDPSVHDYTQELPEFCEIEPGHFVLANRREPEGYRRMLETASC